MDAPTRAKLRSDSELPRDAISSNDRENSDPSLDNPSTATELPTRDMHLIDSEAPRWNKSNTDKQEPIRAMPTIESDEAKRHNDRSDSDDPM
jgi:hypothetical protein